MACAVYTDASHHHPVQHTPSVIMWHAWSICAAVLLQRWDKASVTPVGELGYVGYKHSKLAKQTF